MEGIMFTGVLPFAFFRTTSLEVTEQNSSELCHIFESEPGLKILGLPPPQKWAPVIGFFLPRCIYSGRS